MIRRSPCVPLFGLGKAPVSMGTALVVLSLLSAMSCSIQPGSRGGGMIWPSSFGPTTTSRR